MLAGAIISAFSFPAHVWKERGRQDRARGVSAGAGIRRSDGVSVRAGMDSDGGRFSGGLASRWCVTVGHDLKG